MVTRPYIFSEPCGGERRQNCFGVFKFRTILYSYRLLGLRGSRPSCRLSFANGFSSPQVLFFNVFPANSVELIGGREKKLGGESILFASLVSWMRRLHVIVDKWREEKKIITELPLNAAAAFLLTQVRFRWIIWPYLFIFYFLINLYFFYNLTGRSLHYLDQWSERGPEARVTFRLQDAAGNP